MSYMLELARSLFVRTGFSHLREHVVGMLINRGLEEAEAEDVIAGFIQAGWIRESELPSTDWIASVEVDMDGAVPLRRTTLVATEALYRRSKRVIWEPLYEHEKKYWEEHPEQFENRQRYALVMRDAYPRRENEPAPDAKAFEFARRRAKQLGLPPVDPSNGDSS